MMTPWAGQPAALPLRELILSALAEAFITRQSAIGFCADCDPGQLCEDHRLDRDLARQYDAAYMQVAAGTREWCDLAVKPSSSYRR